MAERVTILGNGAMGTVCAILLRQGGHDVTMWGANAASIQRLSGDRVQHRLLPGVAVPADVTLTANDAQALVDCTMILSAIPTQHMRATWGRLRQYVPAAVPIVSAAKGIETQTMLRPSQIIADVLAGGRGGITNPLAVISGPNIAAEIARCLPATAVVAADDDAVAGRVQLALTTPWFRPYTNCDVTGVELAGATKNVIAIAAGILDGLGAGNNAKSSLVTRGLVEISRLGAAMGAQPSTFAGLAGLGDLITTCISPEGRNRAVGEQLGRGRKLPDILAGMNSVAEGVPTTKAVRTLAARHGVEMPIAEEVYAILFENKDIHSALSDLMTREPKPE